MIIIDQMVQREVLCCMSSLVSTLAQGLTAGAFAGMRGGFSAAGELVSLCNQASELAAPVLDHEEAATQADYRLVDNAGVPCIAGVETWQALCEHHNIDPYEWEVYEHWAVSQWLAEKLQAQGERVDLDFAGLNIWARTTTGQSISMDGCIQRIYADMMAPHTLDSVAPGA